MGAYHSGRSEKISFGDEVNFDHFQVLRAIGKGSFGKVCIVQKKDTKQMFAMKYMNKTQCIERDALKNVLREVKILKTLEHPFLVNLWFSFQDEEDLFMVTDLLLGGDLRYHIHHNVSFSEESVKLLVCEIALALEYLQSKSIIHRDIKPDNILLDLEGHSHLTDFNIATILENGKLASAVSGTKPYIAPEIFNCTLDLCVGYSYPVDWWSLGVVAYELLRGCRPFDIHSHTPIQHVKYLFDLGPEFPEHWSNGIVDLIKRLIHICPGERISTIHELKRVKGLCRYDMDSVLERKYIPCFQPPKNHLNYDPTFELEEMIVETKPLHKKKKRLAKQRSMREVQSPVVCDLDSDTPLEFSTAIISEFKVYNRFHELEKRERDRKELEWEQELQSAMEASNPLGTFSNQTTVLSEKSYQKYIEGLEKDSDVKLRKPNSCDFPSLNQKCISLLRHSSGGMLYLGDANFTSSSQLPLTNHKTPNKVSSDTAVNCDIEGKLQCLDFIDKSPSPIKRNHP